MCRLCGKRASAYFVRQSKFSVQSTKGQALWCVLRIFFQSKYFIALLLP